MYGRKRHVMHRGLGGVMQVGQIRPVCGGSQYAVNIGDNLAFGWVGCQQAHAQNSEGRNRPGQAVKVGETQIIAGMICIHKLSSGWVSGKLPGRRDEGDENSRRFVPLLVISNGWS